MSGKQNQAIKDKYAKWKTYALDSLDELDQISRLADAGADTVGKNRAYRSSRIFGGNDASTFDSDCIMLFRLMTAEQMLIHRVSEDVAISYVGKLVETL